MIDQQQLAQIKGLSTGSIRILLSVVEEKGWGLEAESMLDGLVEHHKNEAADLVKSELEFKLKLEALRRDLPPHLRMTLAHWLAAYLDECRYFLLHRPGSPIGSAMREHVRSELKKVAL